LATSLAVEDVEVGVAWLDIKVGSLAANQSEKNDLVNVCVALPQFGPCKEFIINFISFSPTVGVRRTPSS
jgi:hypothetical protein